MAVLTATPHSAARVGGPRRGPIREPKARPLAARSPAPGRGGTRTAACPSRSQTGSRPHPPTCPHRAPCSHHCPAGLAAWRAPCPGWGDGRGSPARPKPPQPCYTQRLRGLRANAAPGGWGPDCPCVRGGRPGPRTQQAARTLDSKPNLESDVFRVCVLLLFFQNFHLAESPGSLPHRPGMFQGEVVGPRVGDLCWGTRPQLGPVRAGSREGPGTCGQTLRPTASARALGHLSASLSAQTRVPWVPSPTLLSCTPGSRLSTPCPHRGDQRARGPGREFCLPDNTLFDPGADPTADTQRISSRPAGHGARLPLEDVWGEKPASLGKPVMAAGRTHGPWGWCPVPSVPPGHRGRLPRREGPRERQGAPRGRRPRAPRAGAC